MARSPRRFGIAACFIVAAVLGGALYFDPQWLRSAHPASVDRSVRALADGGSPLAQASRVTILVREHATGCYTDEVIRESEWVPEAGGFSHAGRSLTLAQLERIRGLAHSREPAGDPLAALGIGPAEIEQHLDEIVSAALPTYEPGAKPRTVPARLAYLLEFEHLAPYLRAHLAGGHLFAYGGCELTIDLPGQPPLRLQTIGNAGWKLPWHVSDGAGEWTVNDIELSKAVLPLLDDDSLTRARVDGTEYWSKSVWHDYLLWSAAIGKPVEDHDADRCVENVEGYERALSRFRIDESYIGSVNLQPESLYLEISSLGPSLIDSARWWSPLADRSPAFDWYDFFGVFDRAVACAGQHAWLAEWKAAGPERTLELQAVGRQGFAEDDVAFFVNPAWHHAGFVRAPEFEILLRRSGEACGTVWLSTSEQGCLITDATNGAGSHWFDQLQIFFHPNDEDGPTYGRVDAQGKFALRKL